MSKTVEDLKAAFAGESQANRKYTAFAQKADADGLPQIAKLFRAAAHAETVHALNHLRTLGEVNDTEANLGAAIEGENYEVVTMYPEFIEDAKKEDEKKALRSFTYAYEVEKVHENLFRAALEALKKGEPQGADVYDYYVCPVCGYTEAKNAPEKCPVCGVPGSKFERIA